MNNRRILSKIEINLIEIGRYLASFQKYFVSPGPADKEDEEAQRTLFSMLNCLGELVKSGLYKSAEDYVLCDDWDDVDIFDKTIKPNDDWGLTCIYNRIISNAKLFRNLVELD